MTDILVRGVDAKTLKNLKARAKRHGRSLQSEVKNILETSTGPTPAETIARGHVAKKVGQKVLGQ